MEESFKTLEGFLRGAAGSRKDLGHGHDKVDYNLRYRAGGGSSRLTCKLQF